MLCVLATIGLLIIAAGLGLTSVGAQQGSYSLPAIDPPGAAARKAPARGDANAESAANDNQAPLPAINDPNQPAVARQCAELLKMARDLKVEVDKTTQDTLSVTVIRKADAIEELAKRVRDGAGKS